MVEESIEVKELMAVIQHFTNQLPEKCREVFLLSRQEHLSNKEIADRLGISVKTVENQSAFANYDKDQMKMYTAIINAVEQAKTLVDIDLVIPVGTAIQNGRTSVIGDNFCRDGFHLDVNIGRYTASCTWFEALFGKSVVGNTYKPASLSDYEAGIAQHAAHFAILKPNEITVMTDYQDESK